MKPSPLRILEMKPVGRIKSSAVQDPKQQEVKASKMFIMSSQHV